MNNKRKILFFRSITFKLIVIILIFLFLGTGMLIGYLFSSNKNTVINIKKNELLFESKIFYRAIKNSMLTGNAPVAVQIYRDIEKSRIATDIALYRPDGIEAFSDNKTISEVNIYIGEDKFLKSNRTKKKNKNDYPEFFQSVKNVNDIIIEEIKGPRKKIILFRPLLNQPKCSRCHGLDKLVLASIAISTPIDSEYKNVMETIIVSLIIIIVIIAILIMSIFFFSQRVIVKRIHQIGVFTDMVGECDTQTRISLPYIDEISFISEKLNTMLDRVSDFYGGSKYAGNGLIDTNKVDSISKYGGIRSDLTLLFSNIIEFTKYSQNRDPEIVMSKLNTVLNMEAHIAAEFGGIVDRFIGVEIIAVFEGEHRVMRAVLAAEKIRNEIKSMSKIEKDHFAIGISINSGEMIKGNIGSLDRIDRIVIGDAVNIGAKLCKAAGKNTIILSENSYNHIIDRIEVQEHKPIKIKGEYEPVKIYTLRKIL